ncbi:MAG: hypothetical protein OEO23_09355 [Gemmatimonadota bacterium]|nr:hypothetical protein [Gemmatimonadota bacterium]
MRLLSGRAFGSGDGLDRQPTGIINERAAQILFPGADPVGRKIPVGVTDEGKEPLVEIVGVVENVMYDAPDREQFAELLLPGVSGPGDLDADPHLGRPHGRGLHGP